MRVVMRPAVIRVVEVVVPLLLEQQLECFPAVAAMDFRQVLLEHLQLTLEAEVGVVMHLQALLAAMVAGVLAHQPVVALPVTELTALVAVVAVEVRETALHLLALLAAPASSS
jgi:hypothetical protein